MMNLWTECFGKIPENCEEDVREKLEAKRKELVDQWMANVDNERNSIKDMAGSAWAAYNGFSEWCDHQRGRAGAGTEQRMHSNLFGISAKHKRLAFNRALSLV
jgi:hypothetical protein